MFDIEDTVAHSRGKVVWRRKLGQCCRITALTALAVCVSLGISVAAQPHFTGRQLGLLVELLAGPHAFAPRITNVAEIPDRTFEALGSTERQQAVQRIEWRSRQNGHIGGVFGWQHSFLLVETASGLYRIDKFGHFDMGLAKDDFEGLVHAVAQQQDLRPNVTLASLLGVFRDSMRFNIALSNCHHTTEKAFRWAAPEANITSEPNKVWFSVLAGALEAAPSIFETRPVYSSSLSNIFDMWDRVCDGKDIVQETFELFSKQDPSPSDLLPEKAHRDDYGPPRRRGINELQKRRKTKSRRFAKMAQVGVRTAQVTKAKGIFGNFNYMSALCTVTGQIGDENSLLNQLLSYLPGFDLFRALLLDWNFEGEEALEELHKGRIEWGELVLRQMRVPFLNLIGCCGPPSCGVSSSFASDIRFGQGNCGVRTQLQSLHSSRISWSDSQRGSAASSGGKLSGSQGTCADSFSGSNLFHGNDGIDSVMCQIQGLSYCKPDPKFEKCPGDRAGEKISAACATSFPDDPNMAILCRLKSEARCGTPQFSKGTGGWLDPLQPRCVESCLYDCPGRPNDLLKYRNIIHDTHVCLTKDFEAAPTQAPEPGTPTPSAANEGDPLFAYDGEVDSRGWLKDYAEVPLPYGDAIGLLSSESSGHRRWLNSDTSSVSGFGESSR